MLKNTMTMDVAVIGTDDGKNTFEIQRKWKDNGKKAIVIGMYPTITAEKCEMLDVSNMHLLNHVNDFGWGEMRMLNLYATVVNGKPSVSQLKENSLAYIEEILEEKDINTYDIVIAWGNSLSTHQNTIKAKIDLLSILLKKKLNAKCITVDGLSVNASYGIHPLYLGLHYSKSKWKLIDYPVKDVLGELEKNVKSEKTAEKKIGKKVEKKVKTVEKSETGEIGE